MQRDLEFTYAVYKTGSFSQAAKFLYASQPAVSMAVQRTEEELGYQIFDRQTKPLQLTAQGELFIQHIERVRDSEKMLLSELEKTNGTEHARLRIGCTPMHAIYVMPEALSRFREIEPEAEILVINEFPEEMNRCLREYKIDIAVNTISEVDFTDFSYLPAFAVHYLLAVPPGAPVNKRLSDFALTAQDVVAGKHKSRQCLQVPISVFSGTPFVELSEGTEFYEQTRKIYSESKFKPRAKLTVSTPAMALEMAERGYGATVVGHFSVPADSKMLYYRLRTQWEHRDFYLVLRRDEEPTDIQERFIRTFLNYMGGQS